MIGVYDSYNKKPKVQVIKGDFIDRLHGRKSIGLLFLILIMIVFKQTIYSNIVCWFPTALTPQQADFVNLFCWTNSNYIVPKGYDSEEYDVYYHHSENVDYYQFIIFILIGQIFMFYIPSFLWELSISNSNGYINKLLDISSTSFKNTNTEEFLKVFKNLRGKSKKKSKKSNPKEKPIDEENKSNTEKIEEYDDSTVKLRKSSSSSIENNQKFSTIDRDLKQNLVSELNPLSGIQGLTVKYLLLKFLNLANCVGQIFILNQIFSGQFLDYGWKYAKKLWDAKSPLLMTKEFPVFTLCDLTVHQPNRKLHDNTFQCILTMNVLFEKFYVIIWFWLVVLSGLTFLNLTSWIYEILLAPKAQFLHKYLNIQLQMSNKNDINLFNENDNSEMDESRKLLNVNSNKLLKYSHKDVQNFQKKYLGINGIVMLLIIKSVAGDIAFLKILGVLYNDFISEINKNEDVIRV